MDIEVLKIYLVIYVHLLLCRDYCLRLEHKNLGEILKRPLPEIVKNLLFILVVGKFVSRHFGVSKWTVLYEMGALVLNLILKFVSFCLIWIDIFNVVIIRVILGWRSQPELLFTLQNSLFKVSIFLNHQRLCLIPFIRAVTPKDSPFAFVLIDVDIELLIALMLSALTLLNPQNISNPENIWQVVFLGGEKLNYRMVDISDDFPAILILSFRI